MKAKLAAFAPKVPETSIIDGPTFSHPHWHHFLRPIKLFVEKIKEAKQEFCRCFSCDIESYITDILVGQELSVEVLLNTLNTWERASSASSTKEMGGQTELPIFMWQSALAYSNLPETTLYSL